MTTPSDQLDTLRDRIDEGEGIATADQRVLQALDDELPLHRSDIGEYRHLKLLRHCTIMAEQVGGLADALDERAAAEDLVRWINRTYDNEETNRDYRLALRALGRFVGEGATDDPPPSLAWVPAGTSSDYNPTPDPAKMLRWEDDVVPMLEVCHNNRDKALIAVAFDAGPRSGELKALTAGDVADDDHGLRLSIDGKRGERSVLLIPAASYLSRWLADHPRADDDSAPLWCGLHDGEAISDRMVLKILREAAGRAGVDKEVTPTRFRKSSASYLASRGMSQAHLEDHHGWKRGSDAAARYIAVFAEAADRELARIHGQEIEADEPDPIGPITCPRCGANVPREDEFCPECNQALDHETKRLIDRVQARIDEQLIIADDEADRRDLMNFRNGLEQRPDAFDADDLHEFLSSFEPDTD